MPSIRARRRCSGASFLRLAPPLALVALVALPRAPAQETPPAEPPAAPAAAPEKKQVRLGRSQLGHISVARGSLSRHPVLLQNFGADAVQITRVTVKGDPLQVRAIRDRVSVDVVLDTAMTYELPPGSVSQIEVTIDAKEQELGDHAGKITIETTAATLELPVAWEVVEPRKNVEDDRPPPKARTDLSQYAPKGPPPVLTCDRYIHDFGPVLSGERVKTSFKLRNDGDGDLVIIKISTQCHCSLPRLTLPGGVVPGKKLASEEVYGSLKPHEEAVLEVEVDTAGMAGVFKKTVTVTTNDVARSPQTLTMNLAVDNPMQFSPPSVNFGDVRRGERPERTIRMSSRELGKFAVTGYELPQPPPFDVEFREVKPRKDEQCAWELVLRLRDDLPCKELRGRLRLELENERVHSLDQLHYSLRVVPDVDWTFEKARSPETINLGVVRPGTNDVQSLLFENKNPKVPYVLKQASVVAPLGVEPFQTEIVELEPGQRYEVKLKVVAAPKTKAFKGSLVLTAESASLPELKIAFSGIWAGG